MKKSELSAAVNAHKTETRNALQELFDNVNKGQKKQLVKRENIKTLFSLYGVSYDE